MYSSFARTQRAFALVLAVTFVLALAPQRLLGWTSDFAEIVRVPLRPFSHLGVRLGHWFRPPETAALDVPDEARALVVFLNHELDRYKQLYADEQMEVATLRLKLEQIQLVQAELNQSVRLLSASITARAPADRFGAVQLNRGSAHEVAPGSVAIYEGVHVVGRVTDVSPYGSTLLPIVNANTRLLRAKIRAPGEDDVDQMPEVQLEAVGDGTFTADVDEYLNVQLDDDALVVDPAWITARVMTIGRITEINDIEQQPLRKRIVVTPRYQLYDLARVTLKIELDDTELAGVTSGEDQP